MKKILWICATMLVGLVSAANAATTVTTCGQHLADQVGVLDADLDCSTSSDPYIYLSGATLDLAGHTLTANLTCAATDFGTSNSCNVVGPGTLYGCITAGHFAGIADATIAFHPICRPPMSSRVSMVSADNITLDGSRIDGGDTNTCLYGSFPYSSHRILVKHSVLERCLGIKVFGSLSYGYAYSRIRLVDSRMSNAGGIGGVAAEYTPHVRVVLTRSSIENADKAAVSGAQGIALTDSSIVGSGRDGVEGQRIAIKRSRVLGNCQSPSTHACGDIRASEALRVREVECGTSVAPEGTWGVCQND